MDAEAGLIARGAIDESLAVTQGLLDESVIAAVLRAAEVIETALRGGGKLLLFGNGGSASDSSHIATEFVGRFMRERRALAAIALPADQSAVTAIANDYGFERVFARQLEALGRPGDVALAISTSGCSENVLAGVRQAQATGLVTIALTGESGGELASMVDVSIRVPSAVTARVQEGHIVVAHVICDLVERAFA